MMTDDVGTDSSAASGVPPTRRGSSQSYKWAARLTIFTITLRRARMLGASCQIGAWDVFTYLVNGVD